MGDRRASRRTERLSRGTVAADRNGPPAPLASPPTERYELPSRGTVYVLLWVLLSVASAEDLPSITTETPRRFLIDDESANWAHTRPLLREVPEAAHDVRASQASRVVADTALLVAVTGMVAGAVYTQDLARCSEPGLVEVVCVQQRQEEGTKFQIGFALVPGLLVQVPFRLASRAQRRSAVDAYTRVAHPEQIIPEEDAPEEAREEELEEDPPRGPTEDDEP